MRVSRVEIPIKVRTVDTFEELCAWTEEAFELLNGSPRAYMEFPVRYEEQWFVHREVYTVLGLRALGPRSKWERPLVQAMMQSLVYARNCAIRALGAEPGHIAEEDGLRPLCFVRRDLEFLEKPAQPAGSCLETGEWIEATPEECQISMRIAVPGCDMMSCAPFTAMDGHKYTLLSAE